MQVSDYIADYLKKKGVGHVFGYIGGMITFLVDSLNKQKGIKYIQCYHEQTASIAAEGSAISTGKPGVAIATSGPGATNLVTGIADAYFASIPVIYITGQVNLDDYKFDKPIRQQGFQETEVIKIVKPITKYSKLITSAEEVPYELEKAFYLSLTGRPGPVLLDIPINIQRSKIENLSKKFKTEKPKVDKYNIKHIANVIANSKRPLVLIGGGCKSKENAEKLNNFLLKYKIPAVYSLMGKGVFSDHYSNNYGFIGTYGIRSANISMVNSDLIIALGSRLDSRQIGTDFKDFLNNDKIIVHVDIDKEELRHNRLGNRIAVNDTVKAFLEKLNKELKTIIISESWFKYLNQIRSGYTQEGDINRSRINKSPYKLMDTINVFSKAYDSIIADIGQNQMWAAQAVKININQRFFTSGGLAPMGFSIPFAVGMAMSEKNSKFLSINGDGGFHISLQALMLLKQYNLNVTVLVINNESLGMITQFQDSYFNGEMVGTTCDSGYLVPDIKSIALAYDIPYFLISKTDLDNTSLTNKIFTVAGPCIIEYRTEGKTSICPKLEFKGELANPSPSLSLEEMKDIMINA